MIPRSEALPQTLARLAALPLFVSGLAATACGGEPSPDAGAPKVAEQAQAFTVGVERVIPIEAIYLRQATEAAAPADTQDRLERAIAETNRGFARAGIQFYLRSYRAVSAPRLSAWTEGTNNEEVWIPPAGASMRADVVSIFGSDPWPARPATSKHHRATWLQLAVLAAGRPDTEYVFISSDAGSYANPEGRHVHISYQDLEYTGAYPYRTLGHEMAHTFRLNHPWQAFWTNPLTGAPTTPATYWDIAYCPGTSDAVPHRYFADKAEAQLGCGGGSPLLVYGQGVGVQHCTGSDPGDVICTLPGQPGSGYSKTLLHEDPALLRGATFVGSNGAAGAQAATLRSPNITSYLRGPFPGMSPSQIEIVRNTLRFDYRWNSGDIYNGAPNNPYTGKPKLGTATASRPVLAQLDVNGDGARDLVVWTPDPFGAYANSATFTAALAPDFATIQKSTFGAPGDIPVVMDFDNDGIADLGVYRPDAGRSGSQWATASWYWCPSTLAGLGNCSGGGFQGRNFGVAGDEPLVGLKMGTVPYLGVYRPGTATFYWGPASNPAAYSQITLDPLNPLFPRSVLLDDYDGDGKTDLGLHNTNDGSVLLSFSGGNWASAKFLSFPAWSTYSVPSPDPLGALPDERSGGQPIQGLRRSAFGGPRTALALWNPGTQQACVALDPSTADVSLDCDNTLQRGYATTVGAPNDRPLGGLTSTDVVNGVATIAWIANDTGATPRLRRKVVNKASSSMLTERLLTGMLSRGTASFVGDMGKLGTADALPELLVDGKTPGTWLIFWSHTDYATSTPVQMGSVLSRML